MKLPQNKTNWYTYEISILHCFTNSIILSRHKENVIFNINVNYVNNLILMLF